MSTGHSTHDLVERACAGDTIAWSSIVKRFEALVWSTAKNFSIDEADARDVAQTVWMRLAQNIHRLRDPERLGVWLLTTTRNESFKVSNQRRRVIPVDAADSLMVGMAHHDSVVTDIENVDRDKAVWSAFVALPTDCQSLLRLLIADPPSAYVDIAEVCGIAVGSIGSRRQRCLARLRTTLGRDNRVVEA
jgi:RNA polymerase sigma factor (sigma-70 family)